MKRKEAIKQIQEGKIQVCNDLLPSTKEIKKFLKEAFPEDDYLKENSSEIDYWYSSNKERKNKTVINLSTITKRKKTKLNQLEKLISDVVKDVVDLNKNVSELRQTLAKDVEVDAEEVKSELIVGEWYYGTRVQILFMFNGKYGNFTNYGFCSLGKWSEDLGVHKENKYIKATPQEVQRALENEAKKIGLVRGVYFIDLITGKKEQIEGDYRYYRNGCLMHLGNCLFKDGKFAKIIQQETIKEEEIDFSVQDLFIYERGTYIVCSNGKQNLDENTFEGKVIYSTGTHQDINVFSKNWSKRSFKKFKGELTIK